MYIVFFLLVLIVMILIVTPYRNKYIANLGEKMNGKIILPDIIHNNFKVYPIYGKIADFLTISTIIVFFTIMIIKRKWYTLAIFAVLFLISFLIQIVYSMATVLPDSKNGECVVSENIATYAKNLGTCNDLNLSGHLVIIILCLYFLSELSQHKYKFVHILITIASAFFIVASRNHYTIDCLNSIIVSYVLLTLRSNYL